jgi:hypothetical protein
MHAGNGWYLPIGWFWYILSSAWLSVSFFVQIPQRWMDFLLNWETYLLH